MNEQVVVCQELWKVYVDGERKLPVLRGLELEVRRGEIVAVVGPSGVGKSTLLHIIGLLDKPTEGKVFVCGQDAGKLNGRGRALMRREKIGFVFQFYHLLPEFTALENVMLPAILVGKNRDEAEKQARKLLQELGLGERAQGRVQELSGGEQQRVAIARALVNEPVLLLADEPTGNLDEASARDIMELMRNLRESRGTTFIVATHNAEVAALADRVLRLADGILH